MTYPQQQDATLEGQLEILRGKHHHMHQGNFDWKGHNINNCLNHREAKLDDIAKASVRGPLTLNLKIIPCSMHHWRTF